MRTVKHPGDSRTEYSVIIHPADANSIGACFGGTIMKWMDMAASICARRHSNRRVNTVKVEKIEFLKPLRVGHVAHCEAVVVRAFQSSMEIHMHVYAEDTYNATKELAATAIFIFVGVDEKHRPVAINALVPETTEEKALWEAAGKRQKQRREESEHE